MGTDESEIRAAPKPWFSLDSIHVLFVLVGGLLSLVVWALHLESATSNNTQKLIDMANNHTVTVGRLDDLTKRTQQLEDWRDAVTLSINSRFVSDETADSNRFASEEQQFAAQIAAQSQQMHEQSQAINALATQAAGVSSQSSYMVGQINNLTSQIELARHGR